MVFYDLKIKMLSFILLWIYQNKRYKNMALFKNRLFVVLLYTQSQSVKLNL